MVDTSDSRRSCLYGIAVCCFFLSGAAGLVYEVVWTRMLTQVFGNTSHAIATVLAAFMAGLALGSYLFGTIVDRGKNDLRLYGILEAGVGFYGFLVPWLFKLGEKAYLHFFALSESYSFIFNLLLFSLCFILVALPALLMGATLPVLSRFFVSHLVHLGRRVGDLYAVNTFGAVVGTALAGYYMLPSFGMRTTVYIAAGVNLAIAVVIFLADALSGKQRQHSLAGAATAGQGENGVDAAAPSWQSRILLAAFGLSGFAALLYENSWSRALTLVIGTSVYSFTTMLVTFLVGLSLGGFFYARFFGERTVKLSLFGFCQLAIGLSALATIPLFEKFPFVFLRLVAMFSDSFPLLLAAQLLLSGAVMLPTTILLGATFPMVVRLVTQDLYHVGRGVGQSYATNTLGAIVGAFAGGFVLMPLIGVQNTIILAAMINLFAGCFLFLSDRRTGVVFRYALGALVLALLVLVPLRMPRWNPHVLTSGVAIYNALYRQLPTDSLRVEFMSRDDVLFYREGLTATISVHEGPPASAAQVAMDVPEHSRFLRTNGKVDGSHSDALTQLMIGYLPLLLNPHAKTAAVIGLGTGMTAKAVAAFPLRRLDILELEPAVVEAAGFFGDVNGNVLDDSRVHLTVTDARNYLLATPKRYDLITSEPSNPWIAGVANLYTRQFYEGVATKLEEGGIFAQWFHDYSMSPDDLRMVLRTFVSVFPHVSLWELQRQDFLLVGSRKEQDFNYEPLKKIYLEHATFRQDLEDLGLSDVYSVLGFYRMGRDELLSFSDGAVVNTDDGAQLEYSAPRNILWDSSELNRQLMEPFLKEPPWLVDAGQTIAEPLRPYYLAQGLNASGSYRKALEEVAGAIELDPLNADFYLLESKILLRVNQTAPALQSALRALEASPGILPRLLELGAAFDQPAERAALYRQATELNELSLPAYTGMARIAIFQGLWDAAAGWLEDADRINRDHPSVLETKGLLMLRRGQADRAKGLLEEARNKGRDTATLHGALGDTYLSLKLWQNAVPAYKQALRHDMRDINWRRSLGIALARSGRPAEAENAFREVLAIHSGDVAAWTELEKLNER